MIPPYAIFLISFLACVVLTPAVRFLARQRDWVAYPVKDRWHKTPTALMGGVAIYLAMGVPLGIMADFDGFWDYIFGGRVPPTAPAIDAAIWVGATLMFILGIVDDFLRIKPHTKLIGQILAASLMTFLGFRLHWFHSMTLDTLITLFWIVGITNAFNLIDNMDGLCAGVGMIAAVYFGLLFAFSGVENGIPAALLMAGSLAGFLVYNFNPASIFMGDCGSLVIGFTLAMLGIHYTESSISGPMALYGVPVMVLMVSILDTILVTSIRLLSGRKASTGGRDHTSHRLVLMGFSQRQAVLFLYGVGIISGIAAMVVNNIDTLSSPAVIIPLGLSLSLMAIYIAQLRVYEEKEFSVFRNHGYTPILMELTYKRQIVLVFLDFGLIAFSYYLSYRLRFSDAEFAFYFKLFLSSLPAVIACKFIAFFIVGVYRGFWRFMSADDVFTFIKASTLATLFTVAAITFLYRFRDFSKGLFVIDWLLTTGLLLGTRGSFRISMDFMSRKTLGGEKAVIYGAGRGGEILLREIVNNKSHGINPVGFIDDDPVKTGKRLQGYPILGTFEDIERLFTQYGFGSVFISFMSSAENDAAISAAKAFCKHHGLSLRRFSICLEEIDLD
ncbi:MULTISPECIES: glycosyl transferase [Desulfococcus]|uniref:glycosyl transferase n=1 Tax=Desulfococcus TaxID=896 RepID=UPI0008A6D12B|nr:glycosyl transferase [Desulfococcus multivorans]AOY60666.1 glycosyltransferase, family 4 [Desulfococcus multivorans]AQV02748.1 glycosyl transferase [Desulfococcus multivorans]SKA02630.1 UDP-GlcNAc:undecaprenyl-phosphate GlcNAc-1-phosphate transferase [Desulfococcus multivorans DSM 2059]